MTTVREIMSAELVTVDPSVHLLEAAHAMSVGHVGSVLVLDAGALVGIFTERDILRAIAAHPMADAARTSPITAAMTKDPVTVGPDTTVGEALDLMLAHGFRHLPIVEGNEVLGVVSMRDLARNLARD